MSRIIRWFGLTADEEQHLERSAKAVLLAQLVAMALMAFVWGAERAQFGLKLAFFSLAVFVLAQFVALRVLALANRNTAAAKR